MSDYPYPGTDVYGGQFIRPEFLKQCIDEVRAKRQYEPTVLILSQGAYRGLFNAIAMHGMSQFLVNGYLAAGIERVVWAEDLKDGEFLVSSGVGLEDGIETMHLLPDIVDK